MTQITRRALLASGVLVPVAATAACGSAPASSASTSQDNRTTPARPTGAFIMIIRHAEKPTGSGAPYGVNANGEQDSESLTVRGWTRAGALVELFDPTNTPLRAGLQSPRQLYAANPTHGSQRPAATLTPLSARLGITLDTTFQQGQEKELVEALQRADDAVLVAWEHQHIHDIVKHLGTSTPAPPSAWPSDRFDMVWCFERSGDSWTFTQIPQLLLAGDSAAVFS